MLFEEKIEDRARKRAEEIFTSHKETGNIVSGEELSRLAKQEATNFYETGKVLIFANASWLGDKTDITGTYEKRFIRTYTVEKEYHQSSH